MSVYVDSMYAPFRNDYYCHLVADTEAELHEMAEKIHLSRRHFQDPRRMKVSTPHYDVDRERRRLAVENGAIEIDRTQLVEITRRVRADKSWYTEG